MNNIKPPSQLKDDLVNKLKEFSPSSEAGQAIAMALLRMGEWSSELKDLENGIESLILDKKTAASTIREAIIRLSKLENQNGIPLLTRILNNTSPNFSDEFRYFTLASLIQKGFYDIYIDDPLKDFSKEIGLSKINVSKVFELARELGKEKLRITRPSALLETLLTDNEIKRKGHIIHKLKAKDTTQRWAYYFVLVEPEMEAIFLKSIEGTDTIDLENYGKVVASCYGEEPTDEVKNYLKEKYNFNV